MLNRDDLNIHRPNQESVHSMDMDHSAKNIFKTGFILNEKWVIIEFIGKGAMGEVYRAHQLNLRRDVAIKVLAQEMLEHYAEEPEEIEILFQRFRREVQAMARIRHPNVLQIFDYGTETIRKGDKSFPVEYIVMEYIPGATLRYTMPEEGLYPEKDLIKNWLKQYFLPLLDGVEAIHTQDIVHRDLKPENVLLDGDIPKIADFGIARSARLRPVTQSLDIKGTPAYMSPEHFFDFKKADRQSDIYSLGKILFEAISGKITRETLPFKSARLQGANIPFLKKLDQIIQNATAEEKENRTSSVAELRNQVLGALALLEKKLPSKPPFGSGRFSFLYRPRFMWSTVALIVVTAAALGLWHHIRHNESLEGTTGGPPVLEEALPLPEKPHPAPGESIRGRDGIIMRYAPGGSLKVPSGDAIEKNRTVQIPPFYLDENEVTNHHFIEFLNAVKDTLTVREGIVRRRDQVWLYLGEGSESHEQIIYEQGRFYLRQTEYAVFPVVRVTWYGAQAYARYYGKRLLTEYEWDYVTTRNLLSHASRPPKTNTPAPAETHPHMMSPFPDSQTPDSGAAGQSRGADASPPGRSPLESNGREYGKEIPKVWITATTSPPKGPGTRGKKDSGGYNSLVAGKMLNTAGETKNFRYPWEAFADVGFRCARSLNP